MSPAANDQTVLVITVAQCDGDRATDALWRLGVSGIEERRCGHSMMELRVADDELVAERMAEAGWAHRRELVPAEAVESWRRSATSIAITSDLVIDPAWLKESRHPVEPEPVEDRQALRVLIDPEGSFGMGDHPTTQMCARAVHDALRGRAEDRLSVLDVGCGSGVLAIIAALCHAHHVEAIDISHAAIAATQRNARLNNAHLTASTRPLETIDGPHHIVVANLLLPIVRELRYDLARVVAADGVLIVSGILHSQVHETCQLLDGVEGLVTTDIHIEHNWAMIRFAKPPTG